MNDRFRIIVGLVIFLILITFPIWYNVASGTAGYSPELEKPLNATECVRETAYMTSNHMDLLNDWRDKVVREGERLDTDHHGQEIEMSLTRNCLSCHTNKDQFCDKCHDYLGVAPYCWDCHVDPKEVK
jgi:[DsrC]-trisulfide reductase subunit J